MPSSTPSVSKARRAGADGMRSAKAVRIKPFLRWAGSKRQQLGRLACFWSGGYERYVEPFAGSACLFFGLAPTRAIIGDNNRELIEVYRIVRDSPERLYRRLCRIRRDTETYYRWRKLDPRNLDRETRALRFVYLNRNCFNGIFRTNQLGQFNVPIGKPLWAYFSKDELISCASLLKRAHLTHGDFERTIEQVTSGDFVYLDPPFAIHASRSFRQYNRASFRADDMPRLASTLRRIDKKAAKFLVSYAESPEAFSIVQEWNAVCLPVRRHVAGFGDARRNAREWLITNMEIPREILFTKSSSQ